MVFICQFICVSLLLIRFIPLFLSDSLRSFSILYYSVKCIDIIVCHLICPSVGRGGSGLKLEMWMDSNGWVRVWVSDAILAKNNYCAKPNPDPNAHAGSQVRNVLGYWDPRSTLEYDLSTAIMTRPLTQPVTCEMGLSIFAAMTRLKMVSTTSALLPIIPSTERTNEENFLLW